MKDAKRKTVGALSSELLLKPDNKQGVVDTQMEMHKQYLPNIENLVNSKDCEDWKDPFYVVVLTRRERSMVNVIRHHFIARKTLPTPQYDQDTWKYHPSSGKLEYLWTVPAKDKVNELIMLEASYPKSFNDLIRFCKLFKADKLDIVCGK